MKRAILVTSGTLAGLAAVLTYSGADQDPVWWRNLRERPEAVAEVRRERVRVRAAPADPAERDDLWRRLVALYPPFAEYQTRTTRQIPVIVLRRLGPA